MNYIAEIYNKNSLPKLLEIMISDKIYQILEKSGEKNLYFQYAME